MDTFQGQIERGRSPSVGVKHRSVSPSPHPFQDPGVPMDTPSTATTTSPFSNMSYAPSTQGSTSTEQYSYVTAQSPQHDQGPFRTSQQYSPSFAASFASQLEQSAAQQRDESFSNLLNSNPADFDFNQYPSEGNNGNLNPSSLMLDPHSQQQSAGGGAGASVNPADLVSDVSSPQFLTPEQHQSPVNHTSPPQMYSPQHSRHTSLDPVSAAYITSQQDWQGLLSQPAFQTHRRAPSEHSDVSSVSHSPFMPNNDSFDAEANPSPMLSAQNDPSLFDNVLGIESFSLSEQHQGLSPAHSPYLSPQPGPQGTNDIPNEGIYSHSPAPSPFPGLDNTQSSEMGQASQMAPPSINVELAPPSRVPSFGPENEGDMDALSPPSRMYRSNSVTILRLIRGFFQDHVGGASLTRLVDLWAVRLQTRCPRRVVWNR